MRKIKVLTATVMTALTLFSGAGKAQQVPGQPQLTDDEKYACTVILCLANPNGPMAVAECVPPVKAYFKNLMKWKPKPFPKCPSGGGSETGVVQGSEVLKDKYGDVMKDENGYPIMRYYSDVTVNGKVVNRTYNDGKDANLKPYAVAQ